MDFSVLRILLLSFLYGIVICNCQNSAFAVDAEGTKTRVRSIVDSMLQLNNSNNNNNAVSTGDQSGNNFGGGSNFNSNGSQGSNFNSDPNNNSNFSPQNINQQVDQLKSGLSNLQQNLNQHFTQNQNQDANGNDSNNNNSDRNNNGSSSSIGNDNNSRSSALNRTVSSDDDEKSSNGGEDSDYENSDDNLKTKKRSKVKDKLSKEKLKTSKRYRKGTKSGANVGIYTVKDIDTAKLRTNSYLNKIRASSYKTKNFKYTAKVFGNQKADNQNYTYKIKSYADQSKQEAKQSSIDSTNNTNKTKNDSRSSSSQKYTVKEGYFGNKKDCKNGCG